MKKKIKLLLFFCIFSLFISENLYSQSGWYQIHPGSTNYYYLSFVNSETGYCTGYQQILKTTNGGLNWQIHITNPYYAGYIQFINAYTGYVFDDSSYPKVFLKTTDGGSNWIAIQTPFIGPQMQEFFFTNENTGFVGDNWTIYKTTNAGLNWDTVFNYNNYILSFKFIDSNTGFAAALDAVIKTTNQGINWNVKSLTGGTSVKNIRSISIVNNNLIYAAGYYSIPPYLVNGPLLYKSTDIGENWSLMPTSDTLISFQGIWFIDSTKCYLPARQWYGIYFSTNSGFSWNMQYSGDVLSVFFVNNLTGYAAGQSGMGIYKTTTGGITFIQPISNEIPSHFSLSQNYPNPFNPTTKIKFDIPPSPAGEGRPACQSGRGEVVKLKIYDILGREVATLVNEELKPGSYEYEWDGSKFASGVYFYKLTTDDASTGAKDATSPLSITKRMVLIK